MSLSNRQHFRAEAVRHLGRAEAIDREISDAKNGENSYALSADFDRAAKLAELYFRATEAYR